MLTKLPRSIANSKAAKRSDMRDRTSTRISSGCCIFSVPVKEGLISNIFLHLFGSWNNFEFYMREVDIERNEADDLLQQQLWEEIWDELRQGKYDVVVATPPCNSFSRAMCNTHATPGPVPVRNVYYPWGFPWLTRNNKQLVTDHNFLLTQCFTTMDVCMEMGCDFLFEDPEDLGVTWTGEHPASVWQLEQMRKLVDIHQATNVCNLPMPFWPTVTQTNTVCDIPPTCKILSLPRLATV